MSRIKKKKEKSFNMKRCIERIKSIYAFSKTLPIQFYFSIKSRFYVHRKIWRASNLCQFGEFIHKCLNKLNALMVGYLIHFITCQELLAQSFEESADQ